ncbi:MAG: hypothetical protein LC799_17135, partial [Actinobacteria bacterium]|nr:hypothetical protein [Actinomycetota bacterium]
LSTALDEEVQQHNIASVLDLRAQLVAHPASTRPEVWKAWAARSKLEHESVSLGPVSLSTPQAMVNWSRI